MSLLNSKSCPLPKKNGSCASTTLLPETRTTTSLCSLHFDHQKQPTFRLSTMLTGLLQDREALEDFEMDPEKRSDEDEILEQTVSTLGRAVFDFGALVLPLDNEQKMGDAVDDDSTFSSEDSIVVTKRRREQRRAQDERDNKCAESHRSSTRTHHMARV